MDVVGTFSFSSDLADICYSITLNNGYCTKLKFFLDVGRPSSPAVGRSTPPPHRLNGIDIKRAASTAFEWLNTSDALFLNSLLSSGTFSLELVAPKMDRPSDVFSYSRLVSPLFLPSIETKALYPFQRNGVHWLLALDAGVLADDMGLGKTVQAIFAVRELVRRGEARNILILCPKTLVSNWVEEFSKWAPELLVGPVTTTIFGPAFSSAALQSHVLVANYAKIRPTKMGAASCRVDVLIADEAHRLRNEEAKVSSGFRRIQRQRTWLLTGTPLERDLKDVAVLLSLTNPFRFSAEDSKLPPELVRQLAQPFVLRRTKSQVLNELPDVHDITERIGFLDCQRKTYLQALTGDIQNGNILSLLNRLRRICDLDPETKESAKVNRTLEIVSKAYDRNEKTVVFSFLLEPLRVLKNRFDENFGVRFASVLEGSMSPYERNKTVSEFRKEGGPVVLLASTRVSGEGLTLTVANNVIFFNQWWNPSTNEQARDRVVRIGQTRECFVYRLMIRNSVEEALENILRKKGLLMRTVVDGFSRNSKNGFSMSANMAQEVLEESILYIEKEDGQ